MTKNESYSGIDYFRFIAALLIVAIHTSPLFSFSETGNFIFTRIVAPVAVPFFFMTSGFFLISRYTCNAEKLGAFIKKTTLIYGVAILLYIPINVYNGYFKMDNLLPNIIKDIVFDGTLYHLWYLPASIIGAAIAWYLVKKVHYRKAFLIASILYIIGLFGDSYYGIVKSVSCLNVFYNLIFQLTDYTRNGIFFAPIFFVLGGYISDSPNRYRKKNYIRIYSLFCLMFGKTLTLQHFDIQKHDSMYVLLLPSVWCLFNLLLHFRGKRRTGLRTISLDQLYHSSVYDCCNTIVCAELLHLQSLLVENSLVHYIAVCFASVVLAVVITALLSSLKPKKAKHTADTDRAYLEINLNNLEHNVNTLQKAMSPKCELMAVVKAEAYGHGMYEVTTYFEPIGVFYLAVATIDEGIRLRKYGIFSEILILGYTSPSRAKELCKFELTQTLIDYRYLLLLNKQGYDIKAHIKIDTGMHRLGFSTEDKDKILAAFFLKHIKVAGIFTHLCAADSLEEKEVAFTNKPIGSFYKVLDWPKSSGLNIPKVNIQTSYGLWNIQSWNVIYQSGVALYGVLRSTNDKTKLETDLRACSFLKAKVVLIRKIKQGGSVGYSRAFTATRDSLIAILPIGYADGFPRNLSCGNSYVLIGGRQAPIVGKICMDQLAVDVTDIPNVKTGSIATLIGKDGKEEITAPMVAESAESITNELLSRMEHRLNIIRRA
uniref:Amino-acid racemase n=1 Tax=Enterococcus faecalis TaxID=1351 RepID=VANTG_ENTFL|nr:membrane-bound serine racemase VanT-G [Enterococcus faecalis]Q9KHL7.1 RecName: Full=Amino-acid racemase; AltName: Full=Vancomycin G-type resistance protein VanT [Enterococcus faecalis]AAF71283.1 racemase [Enterococcus faecalis]